MSSHAPNDQSNVALRAVGSSRAVFFIASALVYAGAIVSATLTLHPYFSQTWDVQTFIHAARTFFDDAAPFDLYARSRAAQTWPYAYPPLYAFAAALALLLGDLTRALPDYAWARVPAILADIGVALVLYRSVARQANDETIARAAALLWLFNPITFYDTAVQGHFESAWLVFVLLAYASFEDARHVALPALALALAVLFKQIAILFAIPMFVSWIVGWLHSWIVKSPRTSQSPNYQTIKLSNLLLALTLFSLVVTIVCLPFLLHSDDFVFMNLTYVENVPVQTASWLVALLGLTRAEPNALTSDFFFLRHTTIVTMLAATLLAFIGARRGWSVYLTAALIAIAFFLTSKKVMGYYYVMLFPFLLAALLPKRRFDLVTLALVATTYIALAPYYAGWTNHAHWWVYAILGTANSLFWVWLFAQLTDDRRPTTEIAVSGQRSAVAISLGLFALAVAAAWLQPLVASTGSPIRAPIIAAGMETNALIAFGALLALIVVAWLGVRALTRETNARALALALVFAPLFFSVYTLTKESTAIFEIALKWLGV
ncbi:MAG: hypothetical protein FJ009_02760 [Chloroflexi bacterium]|nr:hypothetical protein [Chloroflexota bacterium]